jgi:hypothetical protein
METIDDSAARQLLRPLADDELPPSIVGVADLVRLGRRRQRQRWLVPVSGGAVVTVAAMAAVPLAAAQRGDHGTGTVAQSVGPASPAPRTHAPAPAAPTRCAGDRLPVPAGATESYVLDADPTGRYLVGVARTASRSWTLLWDNGRLTVLDPPSAESDSVVVNSSGVVAGSGYQVAWVYRNGRFTRLPGPAVDVVDINEHGDILGTDRTREVNGGASKRPTESTQEQPVIWPSDAPGTVRTLAGPDGADAAAIDDDGTVVGTRIADAWDSRGLVWSPDGSLRELPVPAGFGPASAAHAVRDGWVLGWYQQAGQNSTVPARWSLRTGEIRPLDALPYTTAVNRHGWVAGFVRDGAGFETPAILVDGRVVTMPADPQAVPSKEGPVAATISDDGRVVGGNLMTGEAGFAVRWTCD